MKTPEQIKTYILSSIKNMEKYPFSYTACPIDFEAQFLSLLYLLCVIDDDEDKVITNEWNIFLYKEIGKTGPETCADFLKKDKKLDENWNELIGLLIKFRKHLGIE